MIHLQYMYSKSENQKYNIMIIPWYKWDSISDEEVMDDAWSIRVFYIFE